MRSLPGRRSAPSRIPRSSGLCCGRRSLWWRDRSKASAVYTEPFPDFLYPRLSMNLFSLMARHGYALTFGLLLAGVYGLPFPAAIALVAAGGRAGGGALGGA